MATEKLPEKHQCLRKHHLCVLGHLIIAIHTFTSSERWVLLLFVTISIMNSIFLSYQGTVCMKNNNFYRIIDLRGVLLLIDCFTLYKQLILVILSNFCITKALSLKGEEERALKHQWQLWIQIKDVLPHRNPPFFIFQNYLSSHFNLQISHLNFAKRKSLSKSEIIKTHSHSLFHPERIKMKK